MLMPRISHQTENTDSEKIFYRKNLSESVFSVWCVARGATEKASLIAPIQAPPKKPHINGPFCNLLCYLISMHTHIPF